MDKQQVERLGGLADPARPLRASMVMALSDAGPEVLRELRMAWPQIPLDRRTKIVRRMVDIAEDDVEVDFRSAFRVFLKDGDAAIRASALEGLWEDETPALADQMVAMMAQDPSALVRAEAARALATFAMAAALGDLKGETGPALRRALEGAYRRPGEEQEVRCQALRSLGYFDDDGVRDLIAEAYQHGEPEIRASAVCAMGANLDPRWAKSVIVSLSSPHPVIRFEAATAAGQLELKEAVPDLLELTVDADTDVRLAAISALGQIGGTAAKRALTKLSKSDTVATRDAAQSALDELLFMESPLDLPGRGILAAPPPSPGQGKTEQTKTK